MASVVPLDRSRVRLREANRSSPTGSAGSCFTAPRKPIPPQPWRMGQKAISIAPRRPRTLRVSACTHPSRWAAIASPRTRSTAGTSSGLHMRIRGRSRTSRPSSSHMPVPAMRKTSSPRTVSRTNVHATARPKRLGEIAARSGNRPPVPISDQCARTVPIWSIRPIHPCCDAPVHVSSEGQQATCQCTNRRGREAERGCRPSRVNRSERLCLRDRSGLGRFAARHICPTPSQHRPFGGSPVVVDPHFSVSGPTQWTSLRASPH